MKKFYLLLMVLALGLTAQAGMMRVKGDVVYYNGTIDVTMMGSELAKGQAVRVSLTENADDLFTFKLPDFRIMVGTAEVPCGDILVEGVTRTDLDGDGVMEIAGAVNDMSLAGGEIHAKVELSGTETANGEMALTIAVGWYTGYTEGDMETTVPIDVTFKGSKFNSETVSYDGLLDVTMMGSELTKDQETTVYLQTIGEDEYLFKLPDFRIMVGTTEIPCGDILVEGVTRTDANGDGVMEIAGTVKDLSLAGGEIHAKVELSGTETANGEMALTIAVGWYTGYTEGDMETTVPIDVTFDGKKNSGIGEVASDSVACYGVAGAVAVDGYAGTVTLYTLDGRMVAQSTVAGYTEIPAAKGLYIVRTGAKATKVIVK